MKKSIGILVALCMIIGILTECSKLTGKTEPKFGDDYIKYETQEGGYSILLPDEPKREVNSTDSPAGKIDFNTCYHTKDNYEYGV